MKKIYRILVVSALTLCLPLGVHAQVQNQTWKVISNFLQPVLSSWGIQVPSLGSAGNPCVTVGTTGVFGTSTCGGGTNYFSNSGATTTLSTGTVLSAPAFAATATSTLPVLRNGEIATVHRDGSVTYTMATTSTDLGRGTALMYAASIASNGDSLYLASSTYDIGSSTLDLSLGCTGTVSLIGTNEYGTVVAGSLLTAPIVDVAGTTNQLTENLSIVANNPAFHSFQFPWGTRNDDMCAKSIVNATLANAYIQGYSDGVYIVPDQILTPMSVSIYNLTTSTQWDSITSFPANGSPSVIATSTISVYNSSLNETDGSTWSSQTERGVNVQNETAYVYDTDIYSYGAGTPSGISVLASIGSFPPSTIYMTGGIITTAGSGTKRDIEGQSNVGNTARVFISSNTAYNPLNTNLGIASANLFGRINFLDNPQIRYSLGSNGASSTMLVNQNGVAAWVSTTSQNLGTPTLPAGVPESIQYYDTATGMFGGSADGVIDPLGNVTLGGSGNEASLLIARDSALGVPFTLSGINSNTGQDNNLTIDPDGQNIAGDAPVSVIDGGNALYITSASNGGPIPIWFRGSGANADGTGIQFTAPDGRVRFEPGTSLSVGPADFAIDEPGVTAGGLYYDSSNVSLGVNLGGAAPAYHLDIGGDIHGTGCFRDSNSASCGLSGQVLSSTGSGTHWIPAASGSNYLTNSGSNTFLNTGSVLQFPSFQATSSSGNSSISNNLTIGTSSSNNNSFLQVNGATAIGATSNAVGGAAFTGTQSNALGYGIAFNAAQNYITGSLGLGSTSPSTKLVVSGTATAANFMSTTTQANVFPNASSTNSTVSNVSSTSVQYVSSLATAAGTFVAADPSGKIIATTTPALLSGLSPGTVLVAGSAATAVSSSSPSVGSVDATNTAQTSAFSGKVTVGNPSAATPLTVTGSDLSGNGIVNITNNGSGTFINSMDILAPNMTTGNSASFNVGQSNTAGNSAGFNFRYQGNNSALNAVGFTFNSGSEILTLQNNGNLGVGTTTPATTLDVNGDITDEGQRNCNGLSTNQNGRVSCSSSLATSTGSYRNLTATNASVNAYTPAASSTYQVSVSSTVDAISAGTLTITCTYTNTNNVASTATFFPMGLTSAGLTTTGSPAFSPLVITPKKNTAVTVVATFTGVSVQYDIDASIIPVGTAVN